MYSTQLGELTVSASASVSWACRHLYTGHSADDDAAIRTIHRALEHGVTHLDTAELYGPYTNEMLLGRALAGPA